MPQQPVVFLLGPTACGKTASSIMLAKQLNAEIISVDSALVYRGMDIGTAKPTIEERDGIRHHLIDIRDPDEAYSAALFCEHALKAIEQVQQQGKIALLTGGTMLYFRALEIGIAPLPNADQQVRAKLTDQAKKLGWPAMHKKLAEIDPEAASRIHPNDPQRLQRALEVFELTGEPLTVLQRNTKSPLPIPPIKFALVPDNRDWLHSRIATRFSAMLTAGLLEEVESLMQRFELHDAMPSMRSVGYRQVFEFLSTGTSKESMIAKAEAATRQLGKRQLTWIRSMNDLQSISCDTQNVSRQVEFMSRELSTVMSAQ